MVERWLKTGYSLGQFRYSPCEGEGMSLQAAPLFDTVPKTNYLEFFGERSKAPKQIARFLDLNSSDVAKMMGVSTKSIRWDSRIPPLVKKRLLEIAMICEQVAAYFDGDAERTALWFRTSNPALGNISPRDMIRIGRYDQLMAFVLSALHGEFP